MREFAFFVDECAYGLAKPAAKNVNCAGMVVASWSWLDDIVDVG